MEPVFSVTFSTPLLQLVKLNVNKYVLLKNKIKHLQCMSVFIFTLAYQDWKLYLAHVFSLATLEDIQLFGKWHTYGLDFRSWNYRVFSVAKQL